MTCAARLKQFGATLLGVLWAIPTCIALLVAFARHPIRFCSRKSRSYPSILRDATWGEHRFVHANGQKIHLVTRGSGPLLLCLHGFPEMWYSYRHQLTGLSHRFTVVAIDMRGYGESSKPGAWFGGRHNYQLTHLVEDVRCVIEALGHTKCTLLAHDWGGVVAWRFAATHPDLLSHLIVLNCPHPTAFVKNAGFKQFLKSWYIFFFQVPVLPELYLQSNDYGMIRAALKGPKFGTVNRDAVSDEEISAYKWAFGQPGAVTCSVNYYRCMVCGMTSPMPIIYTPTLVLWGNKDMALSSSLCDGLVRYVPNLTLKILDNVSHWVTSDAPEAVNTNVQQWIDSLAGGAASASAAAAAASSPKPAAAANPSRSAGAATGGGAARKRATRRR